MTKKSLLFILRHTPYGSTLTKEALDAILASSVYEQNLSILFMDDGVFQLLQNQQANLKTNENKQKNIYKIISSFSMYDINKVFVCKESLKQRKLTVDTLFPDIKPLSTPEVQRLISHQDHLLSF